MFPSSSSDRVCVCSRYNYGLPHNVSSATWYRHLNEATTQEEKQRIRSAKALGVTTLSNLPNSESSVTDTSVSRGARRVDTLRALTQRARESEGSNYRAGRRKRAKIESIDDDNIIPLAAADGDIMLPDNPPIPIDDPIPDNPPIPIDDPIPDNPPNPIDDPIPDISNVPNHDPVPHIPNVPNHDPVPAERHILPHQYAIERRKQPEINVEQLAQIAVLDKIKNTMEYILRRQDTLGLSTVV